jgi:predicted phosphodiesterase
MRYAIISDIHANAAALKAALTDIANMKVDRIICLGDCVGYGMEPVETLELLYRKAHVVLMGNHDAAVCGKLSTAAFSERATQAVERHRKQISPTGMRWLERLPLIAEGKNFKCTHGDFSRPELFRYVYTPEEATPSWQATEEPILFVGHTHFPRVHVIGKSGVSHALDFCDFECEEGKRYIVNPGSIGAPRTDDACSTYCIYDDKARTIIFRSLPFDYKAYVKALQSANTNVDPALLQKDIDRSIPEVREGLSFSNDAQNLEAAQNVVHSIRLPSARFLQGLATTLVLGLLLIIVAIIYVVLQLRPPDENKAFSGFIPAQPLPAVLVMPQIPLGQNLLPPLPKEVGKRGIVEGWRYYVEEKPLQHLEIKSQNGQPTLAFTHDQFLRLEVEAPVLALGSPEIKALRMNCRIWRPEQFNGTVMANLAFLAKKDDGTFEPLSTSSFEVRNTRGEPKGAMSVNRKIPLTKRTTHVRFSLTTTFKGSLEIEQPLLSGEKDD